MALQTPPALRAWRLGVLLALPVTVLSAQPWTPTNPGGGGWFERVGVGPDGTVLAASDLSGAYRSVDGGATWDDLGFEHGLTTTHAAGFAFHPSDASIYFIATDAGIFRTANGGTSFQQVLASGYIESMAIATDNADIGYAGRHSAFDSSDAEVYKTVNGGAGWQVASGSLPSGLRIIKVLAGPGAAADVAYVLTGDGRFAGGPADLFRTEDGGDTWTAIGGLFGGLVIDVATDKFDGDTLWASVDDADPNAHGHLYKSTNRGATWSHVVQHGGFIWLDAESASRIRMFDARYQFDFPGEDRDGFWESLNGGSTWTHISATDDGWDTGWSPIFWRFTASLHSVAEDPSDPDNLYWVNSQFVFATTDRGLSAHQLYATEVGTPGSDRWQSRGVDNVVIIDLAAGALADEVWAGFYDLGLWRTEDGGASWQNCNDVTATGVWEGYGGNSLTVVADPVRPGTVWAPQTDDSDGAASLLMTTAPGTDCDNWTVGGGGLPAAPLVGLSLDPSSPQGNRTLFVSAGGDVWRSVDDGATFSLVLSNGGLHTTTVDVEGNVYAGGEDGLWRSLAGGDPGSWGEVGLPEMHGPDPGPPFWGWEGTYEIVTSSSQPGWVYAVVTGAGKGLYRSTDYGVSWQPRLLDDDFLRGLLIDPEDPQGLWATSSSAIYAGGYEAGSSGVLRSSDGGATWGSANEGLEWPFAIPLVANADGSTLFVGSPGQGILSRPAGNDSLFADGFESGDTSAWSATVP